VSDSLTKPTSKQIDLAKRAIEAAWLYRLQQVGQYAINNRVSVCVFPPDGMAIYRGAQAMAEREASVSDWGGDDTHLMSEESAANQVIKEQQSL
jgi:hypothetical protein